MQLEAGCHARVGMRAADHARFRRRPLGHADAWHRSSCATALARDAHPRRRSQHASGNSGARAAAVAGVKSCLTISRRKLSQENLSENLSQEFFLSEGPCLHEILHERSVMRAAPDASRDHRNWLLADLNQMRLELEMFYPQEEKNSLLARFKEKSVSGVFVGLTMLAMAGWIYLLSSMFLKFMLWWFS
ncbi:hypothetical protein [Bradyrhizobium macuxiense]|nr:hypothetical protein [Bradyrhizobium macuxiense]